MMTMTILALSKTGSEAIIKHIDGMKHLPWQARAAFKASGYKHVVDSGEHPAQVRVTLNNKILESNQALVDGMRDQINKTILENGAGDGDFQIRVEK